MEEKTCCCHKTKERSEDERRKLMNRLNRIEGQIRGIKGMLERDAYCPDILAQAAAANAALNAFSRELLSNHIRSCVVNDVRAGNDEIVDELLDTLQKPSGEEHKSHVDEGGVEIKAEVCLHTWYEERQASQYQK